MTAVQIADEVPHAAVPFEGDWVISSQVGAGGARRMYDFYKLIKELRDGELRCYLTGRLYNGCSPLRVRSDELISYWFFVFSGVLAVAFW